MEIIAYVVAVFFIIIWAWLTILASFAVRHDATLERFQKIAQIIFVWLLPFLGSAFVLHLIWQHYPSAIPKAWIPWPFKKMIFGKAPPPNPNPNRDEDSWVPVSGGEYHHHSGGFGGADGGGDSD